MSMPEFLMVAGVLVFAFACRSFHHVFFRIAGRISFVVATFLAGYYLGGGNILWGVVGGLSWFMLPWLEILTRIRHLRLPLDKKLRSRFPPCRDDFPLLEEFTGQVKEEGFEHVDDAGWEWDEMTQFVRVFYNKADRLQAAIYLNQQQHVAFAYLSISARAADDKIYTTWNYPFSYTMKFSPDLHVNRVLDAQSFLELLDHHKVYLEKNQISGGTLKETDPERIYEQMEGELRSQVNHNLDKGLICLAGKGTFRYSWRGLVFLWFQFVKDMVRIS